MLRWLEREDFPHMIMVGPPGSGKTTSALVFASHFFANKDGPFNVWDVGHPDLLIKNASDERGIDVVRGEIKDFARAQPTSAKYRIIILDEGDKLTKDAQDALRAIVEDNSDKCRFIFLGNDESYIDAIKSRCAIFRFEALPDDVAAGYFKTQADALGVQISVELCHKIAAYYEGDIRKMFNDCLEKLIGIKHEVTGSDLDLSSSTKAIAIKILAEISAEKDAVKGYYAARKYFTSQHGKQKFNIRRFLKDLHELLGPMAFDLAELFAEVDMNIAMGGDRDIQVGAILSRLAICQNTQQ